jgi:predicted outer membrane repeat protein
MSGSRTVTANFALIPVADFSASPTAGNVPLTVQFADESTGDITSWSWNFGEGASPATANTQGPHSVTYNTEGLKTVSLTVTGPGGTDTKTEVGYINVLPPAPVADFSGSPRSAVDPPLTVQFTDESTGTITSREWDFDNDGTTDSTEQNPSYTYTNTGRYTVKLTVTGPGGSDPETKTDYIRVIASANTIYVRTGGSDSNDGSNWALAKKTIQAGITAASADWAVLVAKGTYKATGNTNLDFAGKAVHLKGVTAGASYDSGTTWTIDGENVSDRRTFIFQTSETAHTVVDNFTLYRGNAGSDEGGGVYAYGASPTISNCTVMSCRGVDGGGIYCETGANLTITSCVIKSNAATDGDGGGICCISSSPRIAGCTIGVAGSANTATNNGGGLYCYNSNPRVTDCTFDSNSVTWWGGGIYCSTSSPKIINCQILSNVASDQGGGVYLVTNSNAMITGCTIAGNSTNFYGAGIYLDNSNPAVTNCTLGGALGGNASGDAGGGIYCFNSPAPAIINCSIAGNTGTNVGGGIYCESSTAVLTNCKVTDNSTTGAASDGNGGGGIYCYVGSSLTFTNCTLANNSSTGNGGGIYCWEANSILNNSILWGNTASLPGYQIYLRTIPQRPSTVTLRYSDYADNTVNPNNIVTGNGTLTATNHCIVSDPLFVDAGSGDYRLQATSPCIDTGSDALVPAGITTDLDNNPRFAGTAVDMGAYEVQP